MCGSELETVNDLFSTFKATSKVWYMSGVWVGRVFIHCDNATQHFEQIGFMDLNNLENSVWRCIWITIIWRVWNHGNTIILIMQWWILLNFLLQPKLKV